MKKRRRTAAVICAAAIAALLAAGCGGNGGSGTSAPGAGETDPAAQQTVSEAAVYTVTFMNGEEEIGALSAEEGSLLDAAALAQIEAQPDTEFLGWFETPTFLASSEKDMASTPVTKDMTLYGSFRSTNVAEDTRAWYLAGTSSGGPLAANNWANASVDEETRELFRLQPTGNAVNEFSITIDLFAGDQFQVIHDWAWDGQKGYGRFTQIDAEQMEDGGGLSGDSAKSNVNVIMDGSYTITLTTDPDNEPLDTLTIVRNGDPLQAAAETEGAEFVPSETTGVMIKGSWVDDWSDVRELTRTEDGLFEITMDLDADTQLCFMIYDDGQDTGIVLKDPDVKDEASRALMAENGNNIQVAEDGSYTFSVDVENMTVTLGR